MENSFGAYKRVFMLGIDGMGAFNKDTSTPNMDELFDGYAVTYTALSSRPTISAECWTSMLTGATPEVHGLTNANMHKIDGLPTLFGLIRKALPDAETAAFTDWSCIAFEIVTPEGGADQLGTNPDDVLVPRIENYLDEHDPKFLFVQFDSVDGAGHRHGYGSKEHYDRITHVDGLLGRLIAKYRQYDRFDDTLFIVTADHGGTIKHNHGGWTDGEKHVFLGVRGKTVMRNSQIGEVCLRDYPEIVLYALGITPPKFDPKGYAAQMPLGIFEECGVKNRDPVYGPVKTYESLPEKQKGEKGYITDYIPKEQIGFRLGFEEVEDNYTDPDGGKQVTLENGIIKRYPNGVRGFSGELGYGNLRVSGLSHSDKFSFSIWFRSNVEYDDLLYVITSEQPGSGKPFFEIYTRNDWMELTIYNGDRSYEYTYIIREKEPAAGTQWQNFIFTIDLKNETVTSVQNFDNAVTEKIDKPLGQYFDFDSLSIGRYLPDRTIYQTFDDIMLIDGDFDRKKLEEYYRQ